MFEQAEYISDVNEFTNLPKIREAVIKANLYDSPALSEFRMMDFKLNHRGPSEDEAYALDAFLMKNIRRGNTVIE